MSACAHFRRGQTLAVRVTLATLIAIGAIPIRAQQPAASVDDLIARADEARLANRTDEAISLYRQALEARPDWAQGWAHLGALLYERDAYAEAEDAFSRSATLNPEIGTTWVMLGLCEVQLGQPDEALDHIQHGRRLGIDRNPQLRQVMLFQEGVLLLNKSEFERAEEPFATLLAEGVDNEEVLVALGMSLVRLRPNDLPAGTSFLRDLALRAGRAQHHAIVGRHDDALREYQRLAADFHGTRNVEYALGRYFVKQRRPDAAVAAFERELEQFPDHVPARLGIAAIKAVTDPPVALRYAEEAVRMNPRIPLGHYLLGSLLLHTEDIDRAISELEMARAAVPEDPRVHYALGRAYSRAGRTEEAQQARAEFKRLNDAAQRAARRDAPGGASGDAPTDAPSTEPPRR